MGFYSRKKKGFNICTRHSLPSINCRRRGLDPQEGVQKDKQKAQARHEIESYTKNHSCLSEDCSNKISSTFQ